MDQINPADHWIIGIDASQQTLIKEPPERMTGETWHRAGLDIAREVGLDADAALAQHLHHSGIIDRPDRVTNARGAKFFDRLDDALGTRRLAGMNSDLPPGIASFFEMLGKKPGWFGSLVAREVERHEFLLVVEEGVEFLPRQAGTESACENADEVGADAEIPLALTNSLDNRLDDPRGIQVVVRGHEARAESQLDIADALARGVLHIFIGHAAAGVVIGQHGDHPLELGQKLDKPGAWFCNDHMRPQFLGRPCRKLDVVAAAEIQNRLQPHAPIEMSMQIDQGQSLIHGPCE